MAYLYLAVAILAEVIATTALKATESFTKPVPTLIVIAGYGLAFYCLAVCLKTLNVGVVYATWSGLGIVLVSIAAAVLYQQTLDAWAIVGMTLIIAGAIVLNVLSKSAAH